VNNDKASNAQKKLKVGEKPMKRPQINDTEVGGSRMSRPKLGIFFTIISLI